jgi:hypothetical protein
MAKQEDILHGTQRSTSIRPVVYVVCVIGALGALATFLLWTTEVAYMVGQWYLNFILITSILTCIGLVGIWKFKRWGTIIYTFTAIVTHVILFKYNVLWSFTSLIIPLIVILTSWFYFKKFK